MCVLIKDSEFIFIYTLRDCVDLLVETVVLNLHVEITDVFEDIIWKYSHTLMVQEYSATEIVQNILCDDKIRR